MARSMFDALMDEEKRGTQANPGSASPLGSTLSMKTGAFLHPLLQAAKDKFPKDNPRGRWLGEMLLGDSPQRTGRVAEGIPKQYFHFNRGSGSNVSPEIVDLAGALPIASTLKLAKLAAPLAAPVAMATSAAALNRLKAPDYARTSMDELGSALLGRSLQRQGALDEAAVLHHGSPHKFDALDPTKIGTGERNQAYGHGLYVAENKGVGEGYRENLSSHLPSKISGGGVDVEVPAWLREEIDVNGIDAAVVKWTNRLDEMDAALADPDTIQPWIIEDNRAEMAGQLDAMQKIKASGNVTSESPGYLYEIDVPDEDIAKMLDWDAPLSEQPESVRAALQQSGIINTSSLASSVEPNGRIIFRDDSGRMVASASPDIDAGANRYKLSSTRENGLGDSLNRTAVSKEQADKVIGLWWSGMDKTGDQLHQALFHKYRKEVRAGGDMNAGASAYSAKVSEALQAAGIPGIKYYDQGSRGAEEGTRNMVLFDELARRAKVLKRNDEVIAEPSVDEFIGRLLNK